MLGILMAGGMLLGDGVVGEPVAAAGPDQGVIGQTVTGVLKVEAGEEYYILRDETGTERVMRRNRDTESGEISLKLGDKIETIENAEGRVSSIKRVPTAPSNGFTLKERVSGPQ
jgi:hypothetical protein